MSKVNPYLLGAHVLASRVGDVAPEPETDEQLALQAASEIESSIQQMTSAENTDGGRTVDGGGVSGSHAPARPLGALASPIEGVSDEDWTRWVVAVRVSEPSAISKTSALGMFAFKPRRLADLGLMKNVTTGNARKTGHLIWTGEWVEPLTQDAFLDNPSIQYRALVASTQIYAHALAECEIAWPEVGDEEITLSGALALLHKCGQRGFEQWGDAEKRRPSTIALFEATNGTF